jgi:putative membrane protein
MTGDVREHLANERTFLAWVRSSIALIGFGVVIAKLRLSSVEVAPGKSPGFHEGSLLGLAFGIVGLLTLLFAAVHYVQTRQMIESGDFRPLGRVVISFVAVLFLLLGVTSVLYLVGLTAR